MQGYFEDNPNDLQVLRHDKALHTVRIQQHLADVPEYIVPPTLKNLTGITKRKRKREHYKTSESSTAKFEVSMLKVKVLSVVMAGLFTGEEKQSLD